MYLKPDVFTDNHSYKSKRIRMQIYSILIIAIIFIIFINVVVLLQLLFRYQPIRFLPLAVILQVQIRIIVVFICLN